MQYDVAITAAVFDMWHEGHSDLSRFMDRLAPLKIALVHDDASTYVNKGRVPVQSLGVRMANAARFGRFLVLPVYDADPSTALQELIECRLSASRLCFSRGDDSWAGGEFPGEKLLVSRGIPIILKPYYVGTSSSQLRPESLP